MLAHDVTWLSHRPPPREGSPPGGRRRPSRPGRREDPRTSSGPRRRTLCRLIAISPISSGPPSTSDQSSRMSLISTPGMGTPIGPGRRSGSPRTSTRASNQNRTTSWSSPQRPTPSPPPPSTSQPSPTSGRTSPGTTPQAGPEGSPHALPARSPPPVRSWPRPCTRHHRATPSTVRPMTTEPAPRPRALMPGRTSRCRRVVAATQPLAVVNACALMES